MKFIQKTSLKDHIEKKHKNESPSCADLEKMNSESADLDLLELKDFSLQEYLNQSYEKVEDSFLKVLTKDTVFILLTFFRKWM